MSDKIGRLGQTTSITIGTHTVYTVPAGKTARGRIMFSGQSGDSSTLRVNVAGVRVFQSASITDTHRAFSTKDTMLNTQAGEPTGVNDDNVVAPAPYDYYLDEGDQVTVTIGAADFNSLTAMFVGAEVQVE